MFDYQVSKHPHFESACRKFAQTHKMSELAKRAGMTAQTLRNKLNPDQPHQLTVPEVLNLTDLTEDSALIDGLLAQLQCLPCVPVNELSKEKLPTYALQAAAAAGQVAGFAAGTGRMSPSCKNTLIQSANAGVRFLTLAALAVHSRIQGNPALASTIDAVSGVAAGMI